MEKGLQAHRRGCPGRSQGIPGIMLIEAKHVDSQLNTGYVNLLSQSCPALVKKTVHGSPVKTGEVGDLDLLLCTFALR